MVRIDWCNFSFLRWHFSSVLPDAFVEYIVLRKENNFLFSLQKKNFFAECWQFLKDNTVFCRMQEICNCSEFCSFFLFYAQKKWFIIILFFCFFDSNICTVVGRDDYWNSLIFTISSFYRYLSAARKWVQEGIDACSSYLHLIAWALPALLTIAVFVTHKVSLNSIFYFQVHSKL